MREFPYWSDGAHPLGATCSTDSGPGRRFIPPPRRGRLGARRTRLLALLCLLPGIAAAEPVTRSPIETPGDAPRPAIGGPAGDSAPPLRDGPPPLPQRAADGPALPPIVRGGFEVLPHSTDIERWLRALATDHPAARWQQIGESAGGRAIGALAITAPQDASSAPRLRVMIVGGQHGNETASPEAVQLLAYALLHGTLQPLTREIDWLLVPLANPDGRDLAVRENARGVNTNTDYLQLSQPESQALVEQLVRWRPHAVLDVHESEAYKEDSLAQQGFMTRFDLQYEVGFAPNIDPRLRKLGVHGLLPALVRQAADAGLAARRYIYEITDVSAPVRHGGITLRNFRNYAGTHDVLSTLIEGRIDPPGDHPTPGNLHERVAELYGGVQAYAQVVATRSDVIRQTVQAARGEDERQRAAPLVLRARYAVDPQQPSIILPLQRIGDDSIVAKVFDYHGTVMATEHLEPPLGYRVTRHADAIEALLQRHGLRSSRLAGGERIEVAPRHIVGLVISPPPRGIGRYATDVLLEERPRQTRTTAAGELWVPLDQPHGWLAALLLEPRASSSIFAESDYVTLLEEGPFFIERVTGTPPQ